MVDFKKHLKDAPWWAKVNKPEIERSVENATSKEIIPDLDERDIDAIVSILESKFQEITQTVKENSVMPRGAAAKTRNGLPFLKSDNLTTDKQKFEILWAGTHEDIGMQNKYNAALLVKVAKVNGGTKFLLSLNDDSPVLKVLDAELGADETGWKGSFVFLFNEVHEVTEQKFMRVEIAK